MKPYYQDDHVTLYHGDCIETMRTMPEGSVDSIVTDPPYGLGFMGKKWDALPPGEEWARECLRVLKPGGHLLAFGGTRTWHRLAVAIEDAGFEMRDSLAWLYGSGFPKSHDISKAIDKMAWAEREVIGEKSYAGGHIQRSNAPRFNGDSYAGGGTYKENPTRSETAPATTEAAQWDGWGTALKPAFEPIVLARKPLAEKTVARNVLAHGTGAINVDACRIESGSDYHDLAVTQGGRKINGGNYNSGEGAPRKTAFAPASGRWPANVLLGEHMAGVLDEQSGVLKSGAHKSGQKRNAISKSSYVVLDVTTYSDNGSSGGASRFFYVAKAPKRERPNVDGVAHPTVKPLALMRWLCKLVTPTGGTILDPFAGSGTTIEAALIEGYNVIGIERETDYLPLIQHRITRQSGAIK